jgi:hypothetical protein
MANRFEQAGFSRQSLGNGQSAYIRDNADGTLREFITRHNASVAPGADEQTVDYGVLTRVAGVPREECVLEWGIDREQVLQDTPAYVGCFAPA